MAILSLILSFLLIGIAIYLAIKILLGTSLSLADQERLGLGMRKKEFPTVFLKFAYPIARRIAPSVVNWKIDKQRYKIRKKLASSGLLEQFNPDEFYSFKVSFAFLLPVVVYIYNFVVGAGLEIFYLPLFVVFGWLYPDLWINGTIKKRKEQIKKEMPFVVDLLTLCIEAGLDFGGAMGKVVEKGSEGPLKQEFETVTQEIKLGSMRGDALRNMADRIQIKEISSFVSILITAEKMGSPIGDVLRAQSDVIRTERFNAAEEKGGKAATKVLIPMALFILPAVFIAIFGPMLLNYVYGGSGL
jgi:tight adherence protein C